MCMSDCLTIIETLRLVWSPPGEHEVPSERSRHVGDLHLLELLGLEVERHLPVNSEITNNLLIWTSFQMYDVYRVESFNLSPLMQSKSFCGIKYVEVWGLMTKDVKGTITLHYHLVRIERRSLECASLWMTWQNACNAQFVRWWISFMICDRVSAPEWTSCLELYFSSCRTQEPCCK